MFFYGPENIKNQIFNNNILEKYTNVYLILKTDYSNNDYNKIIKIELSNNFYTENNNLKLSDNFKIQISKYTDIFNYKTGSFNSNMLLDLFLTNSIIYNNELYLIDSLICND